MKLFAMIIVYLAVNNPICAVRVGVIYNASLMMVSSSNITINGSTCNECVCAMLMSSGNSSIVSFNCYITNMTSVMCQLFTMINYQVSSIYQLQTDLNSIFYFLQLPLNNQSQTTTTEGRSLYFIVSVSKFTF
jgi:hypothetical protein